MNMCHCSACHHTFGGISGFDMHRQDGACRPPMSIGLHWNEQRSVWSKTFGGTTPVTPQLPIELTDDGRIDPPKISPETQTTTDPEPLFLGGISFSDVIPRDTHSRDW